MLGPAQAMAPHPAEPDGELGAEAGRRARAEENSSRASGLRECSAPSVWFVLGTRHGSPRSLGCKLCSRWVCCASIIYGCLEAPTGFVHVNPSSVRVGRMACFPEERKGHQGSRSDLSISPASQSLLRSVSSAAVSLSSSPPTACPAASRAGGGSSEVVCFCGSVASKAGLSSPLPHP